MNKNSKIYVAGHENLIGFSILNALQKNGYECLIVRSKDQLDLRDRNAVQDFFKCEKPEYVFFAEAKMGGIQANIDFPVEYMHDNLLMECNVLDAAYRSGVKRLLFLASSCIYPRECSQPIKEEYLLTGSLEQTNEYYAIARISGVKLCEAYNKQFGAHFVPCMLSNIYGPGDDFDLHRSHVIPALIRKFHEAVCSGKKKVEVWGSGRPHREFLFGDDLGDVSIYLMNKYQENTIINVGIGSDISIAELAKLIAKVVGFDGEIVFDPSKPDGTQRKILDVTKLKKLGWFPSVSLEDGLYKTYDWFCHHSSSSFYGKQSYYSDYRQRM